MSDETIDRTVVSDGAGNAPFPGAAHDASDSGNVEATARGVSTLPQIVEIPRGPWSINLATMLSVSRDSRGIIVSTSQGGYVLTEEEGKAFAGFLR